MPNSALKEKYAEHTSAKKEKTLYLNRRLFNTYNRISTKRIGKPLTGTNLDLGCGDGGFSLVCEEAGIESTGFDYPETDLEKDPLHIDDESIDFITMNAVIEHIANPSNLFEEAKRVLKKGGLIFIRTPNWKLDHKNFYDDPTHIKPYSPETMRTVFKLHGLKTIFVEPGLIEKPWFWWTLPDKIKWQVAKRLSGGTKSILAVCQKI